MLGSLNPLATFVLPGHFFQNGCHRDRSREIVENGLSQIGGKNGRSLAEGGNCPSSHGAFDFLTEKFAGVSMSVIRRADFVGEKDGFLVDDKLLELESHRLPPEEVSRKESSRPSREGER